MSNGMKIVVAGLIVVIVALFGALMVTRVNTQAEQARFNRSEEESRVTINTYKEIVVNLKEALVEGDQVELDHGDLKFWSHKGEKHFFWRFMYRPAASSVLVTAAE